MSNEIVQTKTSALDVALDPDKAVLLWKMAETMAVAGVTVPEHLQGNAADCYAVVLQSAQWGMNPFPVAQKTHLIHGKLGYEAQLVNAVINSSGAIKGRLKDEFFGPWENLIGKYRMESSGRGGSFAKKTYTDSDEIGCGVRVSGVLNGETEPRVLEIHMREAGNRNSTLWASNPKQQLYYLAVKMWARKYCPDVILGVYTPDELQAIPVEITEVEVETEEVKAEILASDEELQYIAILASNPAIKDDDKVIAAIKRMPNEGLTQEQAQKTTRIFMNLLKKAKAEIPPMPGEAPKVEKEEPPVQEAKVEEPQPEANAFDRAKAMKRFHAKGNELFEDEWDRGRQEILYSMFQKPSSKDLTDDELVKAIDELHRIEARQSNQQD